MDGMPNKRRVTPEQDDLAGTDLWQLLQRLMPSTQAMMAHESGQQPAAMGAMMSGMVPRRRLQPTVETTEEFKL